MEQTTCACGCDEVINKYDKRGRLRTYKKGHQMAARVQQYALPASKICTSCSVNKPVSEYAQKVRAYKNRTFSYTTVAARCKECTKKKAKASRPREQQRIKEKTYRASRRNDAKYVIARRLLTYRKRNKASGLDHCDLTTEYLLALKAAQGDACYYCGTIMTVNGEDMQKWLSLDRLQPEKGYSIDNVRWCCFNCNTMKGAKTEEEFFTVLRTILSLRDTNDEPTI